LEVHGEVKSIVDGEEFYMVPKGGIIMWSGTLDSIPSGWQLCDGTNGTPDLRERFVYGCTTGQDPGATGGSTNHSHNVDPHTHTVNPPPIQTGTSTQNTYALTGPNGVATSGHRHIVDIGPFDSSSSSPGTDTQPNMPPYYTLAFIMKL
jgi:hypothetical protein